MTLIRRRHLKRLIRVCAYDPQERTLCLNVQPVTRGMGWSPITLLAQEYLGDTVICVTRVTTYVIAGISETVRICHFGGKR